MRCIEVLGSGTGTQPELGNSSLLIWSGNKDKAILIDCGCFIFAKLKEFENSGRKIFEIIDNVFISHLHDDHAGSAGLLAIYSRRKRNKALSFSGANIENVFKYTLSNSKTYCNFERNEIFEIIPTKHSLDMESYACLVNDVLYSGDTADSLLNTIQAEKAKIIIHEVTLRESAHHTSFSKLVKAPSSIKGKTYLNHYSISEKEELVKLAKENGFAGVLEEGQIINY